MTAFGDAFKKARQSGKKTFSFQGKLYHTKTKDELAKGSRSVPVPTPKPKQSLGSTPKSGPSDNTGSARSATTGSTPKSGPTTKTDSTTTSSTTSSRSSLSIGKGPVTRGTHFSQRSNSSKPQSQKDDKKRGGFRTTVNSALNKFGSLIYPRS